MSHSQRRLQQAWAAAWLLICLSGIIAFLPKAVRAGQDACPEPNDGRATACTVVAGSSTPGFLDTPEDVDRYRLEIGPNQMIDASIVELPGDYGLQLEEASGALVVEADKDGIDGRTLKAEQMPAGTYYLVVYSRGGDFSADVPYALNVGVLESPARTKPTATPTAGPKPSSSPQSGASQPTSSPAGPPQTAGLTFKDPAIIALSINDAGKDITEVPIVLGSDDRSQWAETRYIRTDVAGLRLGPSKIFNKVYTARDVALAEAIYKEQVALQSRLPEGQNRSGPVNPNDGKSSDTKVRKVGEELDSVYACNVDCGSGRFDHLHQRTVFRWKNYVAVLYFWGPDKEATTKQTDEWTIKLWDRMRYDIPPGEAAPPVTTTDNGDESDESGPPPAPPPPPNTDNPDDQ